MVRVSLPDLREANIRNDLEPTCTTLAFVAWPLLTRTLKQTGSNKAHQKAKAMRRRATENELSRALRSCAQSFSEPI